MPHISDLPSKYGNELRIKLLGNTTCLGYGTAEFHVVSKSLPSFSMYQTCLLKVHLRVLLPLTSNGLTNAPEGFDGETYTLGMFSVPQLYLRQLTGGDLHHEILTYSNEVPCY